MELTYVTYFLLFKGFCIVLVDVLSIFSVTWAYRTETVFTGVGECYNRKLFETYLTLSWFSFLGDIIDNAATINSATTIDSAATIH